MKNQLYESFNCKFLTDLSHNFDIRQEADNKSQDEYVTIAVDFMTYLSTLAVQLHAGQVKPDDPSVCKKISECLESIITKNPDIVSGYANNFDYMVTQWFGLESADLQPKEDMHIEVKSVNRFKETVDNIGIKNTLNALRKKLQDEMLDGVSIYTARQNGTIYSNFRNNISVFNNFKSLTEYLSKDNMLFSKTGLDLNSITDDNITVIHKDKMPKNSETVRKKYSDSILLWFGPKNHKLPASGETIPDELTDNDVLIGLSFEGGINRSPFVFDEYFENAGLTTVQIGHTIPFLYKWSSKIYAITADWYSNTSNLDKKREERDKSVRVYKYTKLVSEPDDMTFYNPYINNFLVKHNLDEIPVSEELPDPNDPRGNSPDIVKVLKNNTIYIKSDKEDSLKIVVNTNRYERYATYWVWIYNKLSDYKKQVVYLKINNSKIDKLVENTINKALNFLNEHKFSILDQPTDDSNGVIENYRILFNSIDSIMNYYKKDYLVRYKERYRSDYEGGKTASIDITAFKDLEKNIMKYVNLINEIIEKN